MNTVVYDAQTGEILRLVLVPEYLAALQAGTGEDYLLTESTELAYDLTHYVDTTGPTLTEKNTLNTTFSRDGLTLTFLELPPGLHVMIGSQTLVVDGEPTEITFDIPGTYTLDFYNHVQFLDTTLEVTVNA